MEAKQILRADLLDLIFEHRNKLYGAYELRKKYGKRLLIAILLAMAAIAIAISIRYINAPDKKVAADMEVRDVVVQSVETPKAPPPPPEKKETPPPAEKAAPVKAPAVPKVIQTTQFTPPVIKKDAEVQAAEVPPVTQIQKVDVISTEGLKDKGVVTNTVPEVKNLPPVDKGTGVVEAPKKVEDENKIFEKVEIEASVNASAWRRHLESHLQRYIEDAANSGMSAGKYTVNVRFLVEKDGSISDVNALSDPGYGLGKAAESVVKQGPKWSPGEQNGKKVRSYHTQPISFVISEN